jgi:pimeloyl-ACP methyl ester carboxylesterase
MDVSKYRAAERRLWESVQVTPTDLELPLPTVGCTVRAQEAGEGPPLLFIHGGATAGASWAHLVARLSDYRCIVIDRPGCGLSEPLPGTGWTDMSKFAAFAEALVPDIVDALGLSTIKVAATSHGGFFAFRGAAAAPERVERLIEYSWPMGAPMEKVPMTFRLAALPGAEAIGTRLPANPTLVKMALSSAGLRSAIRTGKFHAEAVDWMVSFMNETPSMQNEMRMQPKVITPIAGLNKAMLHPPELLSRLTMPIHLFWGEDDPNGGEETARLFVDQLPNATLEMVPGAGHAPWVDEPDRAAASTREFLGR